MFRVRPDVFFLHTSNVSQLVEELSFIKKNNHGKQARDPRKMHNFVPSKHFVKNPGTLNGMNDWAGACPREGCEAFLSSIADMNFYHCGNGFDSAEAKVKSVDWIEANEMFPVTLAKYDENKASNTSSSDNRIILDCGRMVKVPKFHEWCEHAQGNM